MSLAETAADARMRRLEQQLEEMQQDLKAARLDNANLRKVLSTLLPNDPVTPQPNKPKEKKKKTAKKLAAEAAPAKTDAPARAVATREHATTQRVKLNQQLIATTALDWQALCDALTAATGIETHLIQKLDVKKSVRADAQRFFVGLPSPDSRKAIFKAARALREAGIHLDNVLTHRQMEKRRQLQHIMQAMRQMQTPVKCWWVITTIRYVHPDNNEIATYDDSTEDKRKASIKRLPAAVKSVVKQAAKVAKAKAAVEGSALKDTMKRIHKKFTSGSDADCSTDASSDNEGDGEEDA